MGGLVRNPYALDRSACGSSAGSGAAVAAGLAVAAIGTETDGSITCPAATNGGPALVVDRVNGSRWLGSPSSLPAVAGYPHLTVPMGYVEGLPVGLSFIGTAWADARLLALGYAFEQATKARRAPTYPASVNGSPAFDRQ